MPPGLAGFCPAAGRPPRSGRPAAFPADCAEGGRCDDRLAADRGAAGGRPGGGAVQLDGTDGGVLLRGRAGSNGPRVASSSSGASSAVDDSSASGIAPAAGTGPQLDGWMAGDPGSVAAGRTGRAWLPRGGTDDAQSSDVDGKGPGSAAGCPGPCCPEPGWPARGGTDGDGSAGGGAGQAEGLRTGGSAAGGTVAGGAGAGGAGVPWSVAGGVLARGAGPDGSGNHGVGCGGNQARGVGVPLPPNAAGGPSSWWP